MDIAAWLRSLGLEQYEQPFRENEIDDAVLPNLTAKDLKGLGIGIVRERPLLPHVSVPTLVLHRRDDRAVRIQEPVLDGMQDFIAELDRKHRPKPPQRLLQS